MNHGPYFGGCYDHALDLRRRVCVPRTWELVPGERCWLVPGRSHGLPFITVLRKAELKLWWHHLGYGRDLTPEEKKELADQLSRATGQMVTDASRIRLPQSSCDHAGLLAGTRMTLVGRGFHFEFWNSESFGQAAAKELEELDLHGELEKL